MSDRLITMRPGPTSAQTMRVNALLAAGKAEEALPIAEYMSAPETVDPTIDHMAAKIEIPNTPSNADLAFLHSLAISGRSPLLPK